MNETIYRKSSIEKVTGPEQLDDYIRVASPGLWVTLGAIVVLLISAFVWSAFGALPTTLSIKGVAKDGVVTFYLPVEEAAKVRAGMPVKAGTAEGPVTSVGQTPLSRAEVSAVLQSDYLAETLMLSGWNVPVTADISGLPDGIVQAAVTVDTVRPLDFLVH